MGLGNVHSVPCKSLSKQKDGDISLPQSLMTEDTANSVCLSTLNFERHLLKRSYKSLSVISCNHSF